MSAIPASMIVQVTPSVISAGGTALDINGLILTSSGISSTTPTVPIGQVFGFPTAAAVGAYFGLSSNLAALAGTYFSGFNNSNKKPGQLLIAQYPWSGPVSGWLQGGSLSGLTLAALQAITSGTLTVSVDGTPKTSSTLNLSAASSFSAAAALIQTALGSGQTVTYSSVSNGFLITSATTGATSAVGFVTGTPAATLGLTQATGAIISPGSAIATPSAFMTSLANLTQNWVAFMTDFEPVTADKMSFGLWTSQQNDRYLYAAWDTSTEAAAAAGGDTTSFGYQVQQANYSGVAPIARPTASLNTVPGTVAAFLLGALASVDYTETQGKATMAYKSQSGINADVTSETTAVNLQTSGYNYYGTWNTANQTFFGFAPGSVSGPFEWIDDYVNEIWLTNQFQLAIMTLLFNIKSIPYNAYGRSLIEASIQDVISQAVNFGMIQPGVTLSSAQIAEVNGSAGAIVAPIISSQGWYLQVNDATPQVRAARGSPPCTFWYTSGGSVQTIALASIEVA